jgi:hypothetical protein
MQMLKATLLTHQYVLEKEKGEQNSRQQNNLSNILAFCLH